MCWAPWISQVEKIGLPSIFIIVHSKHFPNSDWLKAHAWKNFVFNEEMTSKMQPSTG